MRIVKVLVLVSLIAFISGCTCRTRKVGPGDNIPVAGEGSVLKDVNFAFDSYVLDAMAQAKLRQNFEWLKANPGVVVQIEGHCDERGTAEYNMALGSKRARAAMEYLLSLGLAGDRLSTVSYGEELPLDPGHNEQAWAKNRRAHFAIK
jgi:peptidoglycan-associated lipoprotein